MIGLPARQRLWPQADAFPHAHLANRSCVPHRSVCRLARYTLLRYCTRSRSSMAVAAVRDSRPFRSGGLLGSRSQRQNTHCLSRTARAAATSVGQVSAADLSKRFGIPGSVDIVETAQGLKKVVLTHASGTSAEVYLYGACITSWKQPSGDEVLFVRPDAKFDGSKPISGGIPHCFPQFGPGELPQHGFARNQEWSVTSSSADPQPDDKEPEVTMVLEDSAETRKLWNHKFKAVYSVSLHGEQLRTDLRIINTCDRAFEFTAALHSYIEVQDISLANIEGLKGLDYLDKVPDVNNPVKKKEKRELVTFDGPADAVYIKAPERVALAVGTGAAVQIVSKGWQDVVVWNPHTAMADCYKQFACVENAQFASPVRLNPGEDWRAEQEFSVIDL